MPLLLNSKNLKLDFILKVEIKYYINKEYFTVICEIKEFYFSKQCDIITSVKIIAFSRRQKTPNSSLKVERFFIYTGSTAGITFFC
ncbi:hypothetical protein AKUG0420_PLPX00370 (plasmid) [Apilactobacillus kunkeei]|nr:hypothetical protein AKUG0420_PLPX00370 [Apilactobacillus kunkeei]